MSTRSDILNGAELNAANDRRFSTAIDAEIARLADAIGAPSVDADGCTFQLVTTDADNLADSWPRLAVKLTLAETDFLAQHVGAVISTDNRGNVDVSYFADADNLADFWQEFADADGASLLD